MPYITDEQAVKLSIAEETLDRVAAQYETLIDALDDVVLVLRSGAAADVKLLRIEDVLSTAVSEAAAYEIDNRLM